MFRKTLRFGLMNRPRVRLISRYYDVLARSQYDPPAVIARRQLCHLRKLLAHAYETTDYYRRLLDTHGIHPSDITTLDRFPAVPVLPKEVLREDPDSLLSSDYRGDRTLWTKKTSGSTGIPLAVKIDTRSLYWKTACTVRSDEWSGWRAGEPVGMLWGNPKYRHEGLRGRLRNYLVDKAVHLDTLTVNFDRMKRFAEEVLRRRATLLFGHAHSIFLFANFIEANPRYPVRPRAVVSTAMVLHDWQRRAIERAFGCKVTNRYGCEETSLIACECERHEGLHINSDGVYAEVVDEAGDPVVGRPGFVTVTDLTNYVMPLVRYQVGDVAVMSDRRCPCGRTLPMLERLEGREADYVVTATNDWISGVSLTENFAVEIPAINQLQILQEADRSIRLRVVRKPAYGPESARKLHGLSRQLFGEALPVTVEYIEFIPPEPSGKFRFCKSKVSEQALAAARAG
jgi:phenylacetate-CoA ligase